MSKLNESLQYKDLEGLVKSDITVDVYSSKAFEDSNTIVLSFRIKGELPAEDLEKFIEKGYKVLDAEKEISADDDGQGAYDVFVEIERTPAAIDTIDSMLDDLLNLVEFEHWNFTYYKDEKSIPYNREELLKRLPTSSEQYKLRQERDIAESVQKFIGAHVLDKISLENDVITFNRDGKSLSYKLVREEIDSTKVDMSATALRECSELDKLLIRNVLIHKADGHLVLNKNNRHLYLKPL